MCSVMSDSLLPEDCSPPGSFVEFSRQVYWSRLPFPSPGDLSNPGVELVSLVSPALQVNSLPLAPPGEPLISAYITINKIVK